MRTTYHFRYEVAKYKTHIWEYMFKPIYSKYDPTLLVSNGSASSVGQFGGFINHNAAIIYLARKGQFKDAMKLP